jgi:hypothetical protein
MGSRPLKTRRIAQDYGLGSMRMTLASFNRPRCPLIHWAFAPNMEDTHGNLDLRPRQNPPRQGQT